MSLKHISALVCCLLISLTAHAADNDKSMIIVDAGSSESRLHVYKYTIDQDTSLPDRDLLTQHMRGKVTPGIENIEPDKYDHTNKYYDLNCGLPASTPPTTRPSISPYLQKLFTRAKAITPPMTPVYFYATAGMRLTSPDTQKTKYENIRRWLNKCMHYDVKAVKTISGKDEGAFGWLALNYLLDNLDKKQNETKTTKTTAGLLDMGGASTEIVFEVDNNNVNKTLSFNFGERKVHLYSQSYLGLGQDQARNQFTNNEACFQKTYELPNGEKGEGDYHECAKESEHLINAVHNVHTETKAAGLPEEMPFYAISAYSYVAKDCSKKPEIKTFIPKDLSDCGATLCNMPWNPSAGDKNTNLYALCFNTAYHARLLTEGYGFKSDKRLKLSVPKANSKSDLDWTLGVLICAEDVQCKKSLIEKEKKP